MSDSTEECSHRIKATKLLSFTSHITWLAYFRQYTHACALTVPAVRPTVHINHYAARGQWNEDQRLGSSQDPLVRYLKEWDFTSFFLHLKKTKLKDLDKPEMFPLLPRISNLTFQSDLKINIHYSMLTVLFF